MLETMRNSSGSWFVKLIMLLIICSFGLWGIGGVLKPTPSNNVAKVGEYYVTVEEYYAKMAQEMLKFRMMSNVNISNEDLQKFFSQSVLANLIESKLIRNEAAALGLAVDDAYVLKRIADDPKFKGLDDTFSKDTFKLYLKRTNISEKLYVDMVREAALNQLLLERMVGVSYVPKMLAEDMYRYGHAQKKVDVIRVPVSLIMETPQPTDAELVQFYQDNKANYQTEEKRKFTYLSWNGEVIGKSITPTDEELQEYYDDNVAEFTIPEKRDLRNIVVNTKTEADSIYAKIKEGGDFSEIAKTELSLSDDSVNMGVLSKTDVFDPDVAVQVFALEEGQVSQPIKSSFGWHIFKVARVLPSNQMPFDAVKNEIANTLSAKKAEEKVYELAGEVEDAIAGGMTFEEIAKEYGLEIQQVNTTLANEANAPTDILKVAFETEEESELIARNDGGYAVVRMDTIDEKREKALDTVRGVVSEDWAKAKQKSLAKELAEKSVTEFMDGTLTKTELGKALGQEFSSVLLSRQNLADGWPVPLQQEMLNLNETNKAIARPLNAQGDYAIAIFVDTPKLEIEKNKMEAVINALKVQQQQDILAEYIDNYLRKKYVVESFM